MSAIKVQLPDGSTRSLEEGSNARDLAGAIGSRLAKDALAAQVNGELTDLTRPLENGDVVAIVTPASDLGRDVLRHSTAHVLAQAVVRLWPGAYYAIGPSIRDGFYYDFELPHGARFSDDDLGRIEDEMRSIVAEDQPFLRSEYSIDEGLQLFKDQPFKVEIISGVGSGANPEDATEVGGSVVSTYSNTPEFQDLCRGPHVPSTGRVKAVRVMSISGAYWLGNEKNPQLQRIYGTAFFSKKDLDEYLERLEDAKKRDHRRLGKELELFTVSEDVGAGLPLWLPKGATIRRLLEEYILDLERRAGYEHVYTPSLAKVELYIRSGHWEHYHEDMFPPMDLETERMVLRPMNCPHHILIYESKPRSYRDLPVRLAELGTMYRYERSGVLSGLSRVRCMTLNDAHIFCTPEQIKEEFSNVMKLVERSYRDLGITKYSYRLSLRDPANKEKYVDNDEMWTLGERVLREALDSLGLSYREARGEAAFYGPKLDIQLADVMGHEETYSTIQVDFHLPSQFGLEYAGADGKQHRPVMIHRAIISTMERMVSYLIELCAGAFPLWLAPVQVGLVPISERHLEYAKKVEAELKATEFRVEVDARNEKMNAKIRDLANQKTPYILVFGDKEEAAGSVSVRTRGKGDQGSVPLADFIAKAKALVAGKSTEL